MFNRLFIFVLAMILGTAPGFAAGTIPGISMTQQLDSLGRPLNGGKLYLIQAGTTSTPQNCYQDSGLTLPWPNPITLDSAGRIPQLFCADGSIKIRLTNSAGVQQLVQDNLLVVGPSGGGGGGGSVDPTTVLATGDFKLVYNTGVLTGFVRCNGRTIGAAASGATERANADTSALFSFLWSADANLAVSGGRGASGAADFSANKTITLPDCRGRGVAGLSDMGNADSGRVSTTYFGCTGLVLGCAGGSENTTLTTAQLPSHQHNVYLKDPGHVHGGVVTGGGTYNSPGGATVVVQSLSSGNSSSALTGLTIGSVNGVANDNLTAAAGSGSPHRTVQPTILATIYIKL